MANLFTGTKYPKTLYVNISYNDGNTQEYRGVPTTQQCENGDVYIYELKGKIVKSTETKITEVKL